MSDDPYGGRKVLNLKNLNSEYDMRTAVRRGWEMSIIKNEVHYEYWVDTLPFYRNIQQEGVVVA